MFKKRKQKIQISPSIFAADTLNLEKEIKLINKTSCEMIHVDIMDGIFVPNVSLPLSIIDVLNKKSNKILDVHLMVKKPIDFINNISKKFKKGIITIHLEAEKPLEALELIKKLKFKAGVVIKPETSFKKMDKFLKENHELIDNVLVMGVTPGFSGQKFKKETINTVKNIRNILDELKSKITIEVDGGVNDKNMKSLKDAGANILVAGSYIFSSKDYEKSIKELR
ncbi:MAG: ribulose-phosphate 3-epimerase [Alphaproteobacteria bacterium]|jgi:ribulose-phosphate 3-epimerase|nr:ribulose-phosphate 3-epimerase [Alphaproteobacteria bacterium]